MTARPHVVLAAGSVAIIACVDAVGAALAPGELRLVLLLCGAIAVVTAAQNAVSKPAGFIPAVYFSLPPVVALVLNDAVAWLVGPFAALLLVACEFNALGREVQGSDAIDAVVRRRLLDIARLGALGIVASSVIGLLA